jgi:hypothetical protein
MLPKNCQSGREVEFSRVQLRGLMYASVRTHIHLAWSLEVLPYTADSITVWRVGAHGPRLYFVRGEERDRQSTVRTQTLSHNCLN